MMVFPFERSGDLMIVEARVWGSLGSREALLVIDTGAAATSIEPALLERLGYSSRDAIARTRVTTPAGVQQGHLFRVDRFATLGAEISSFVIQALALDDEYGVNGLLGMNFLENFNFTVRPREMEIHLEPVVSGDLPTAA
jgi:clan AA aspartic protease (TIGR02281 family)